ncbi:MAG: PAS domain-containing protein, partial [Rhodoferax sp.]
MTAANSSLESDKPRLRAEIDRLPALVSYWDTRQRARFGNQAYTRWFGVDPSNMAGMHLRDVLGAQQYGLSLPFVEAALHGEEQRFERVGPKLDGADPGEALVQYFPDIVDGQVRGFYSLTSDIAGSKQNA